VQIYVMVCMAFLGAVTVTWRRMHLRIDVLAQMPAGARRVLGVCERLLVAVLSCFVLVFSWKYVGQMLMLDRRSDNAGIPMRYRTAPSRSASRSSPSSRCGALALLLAGDPAERAADQPAPAGADAS
jgi:TRAP-type C4-dicarboxylate transport system permease small subunit